MNNKISTILNTKRNMSSTREDVFFDVNLENTYKELPLSSISDNVNQYEQYLKEKDTSDKYRLSFTISPYCTNILFNRVTEIMWNDDNNNLTYFVKKDKGNKLPEPSINHLKFRYNNTGLTIADYIDREGIIRDTSLSHPKIGNLTYYCGIDIFANHRLRYRENVPFNKYKPSNEMTTGTSAFVFNTISDYIREWSGEEVKGISTTNKNEALEHVYSLTNIYTTEKSITNGLKEENGWFGFINKANMDTNNDYATSSNETITINRCLLNKKPCEFVDMYPTRDLFSVLPFYNSKTGNSEHNWRYFLTYPYENKYNNDLIRHNLNDGNIINGLRGFFADSFDNDYFYGSAIDIKKLYDFYESDNSGITSNSNSRIIYIRTYLNHNLNLGDTVNISFIENNGNSEINSNNRCRVIGLGIGGKDIRNTFSIIVDDIMSEINQSLSIGNGSTITSIYIRKIVNEQPCNYYLRIFKKIEDITDNIGRLGFSNTIYGDQRSEIILDKDIDISDKRDNLGRKLTEVYLTLLKTNKGYKERYSIENIKNGYVKSSKIEQSSCFGEVTSGVDIIDSFGKYNIHLLHNIDDYLNIDGVKTYKLDIPFSDSPLESDLNEENELFYGDFVELNLSTLEETTLNEVCHRFNTAQRECFENGNTITPFNKVFCEDIIQDDYGIKLIVEDVEQVKNETNNKKSKISARTKINNNGLGDTELRQDFNDKYNYLTEADRNKLWDEVSGSTWFGTGTTIGDIEDNLTESGNFIGYTGFKIKENTNFFSQKKTIGDFHNCGNIAPEGYFYKAHYKVKLKELSDFVNYGYEEEIVNTFLSFTTSDKIRGSYTCLTDDNYYLVTGDTVIINFYKNGLYNNLYGKVQNYEKEGGKYQLVIIVDNMDEDFANRVFTGSYRYMFIGGNFSKKIFKYYPLKSDYSYNIPDGSGRYIWRDVKKTSEITTGSELYDQPFTNGATYIHKDINFYLKRQDPYGIYGLSYINSKNDLQREIEITGKEKYVGDYDYYSEGENSLCY